MPVDVQGIEFAVGQKIARAAKLMRVDGVHVVICHVTKINGDKIYLDDSPQPLRYPNRVAIMNG